MSSNLPTFNNIGDASGRFCRFFDSFRVARAFCLSVGRSCNGAPVIRRSRDGGFMVIFEPQDPSAHSGITPVGQSLDDETGGWVASDEDDPDDEEGRCAASDEDDADDDDSDDYDYYWEEEEYSASDEACDYMRDELMDDLYGQIEDAMDNYGRSLDDGWGYED